RKRVAARLNLSFMDWNPQQYLKFGGQRLPPAQKLLARVTVAAPQRIGDLGCGMGTVTLLRRALAPASPETGYAADDRVRRIPWQGATLVRGRAGYCATSRGSCCRRNSLRFISMY